MLTFLHLESIGFSDDRVSIGHIKDKKRSGENKLFCYFINLAGGSIIQKVGGIITPVVKDSV